ncbi:DUF6895 family protein [Janthinobacterium fluminis]|uniref:DUF6895 domain-containing protein n=1 Tax=Janthinobacterium fluminis TaxID=2987524 RepID=A0ABT5K083_9BURK|nr:hypothetical protein [Janthinobacterium fluminis]MDC8758314.1 hypothetical protein [Janthinobacterium fluminis]
MQIDIGKISAAKSTVLDWLLGTLEYANPFLGEAPGEILFRRKCFNELALFLMFQERFSSRHMAQVDTIRAFFADTFNDDYLSLAARRSETLLMFGNALAYAARSAMLSPAQHAFVRAIVSGPFAWSIDASAFRHMELLLACHYAGVAGMLSAHDVFKTSALATVPSPIYGSRNSYYALTHAAFYRFLLQQPPLDAARDVGISLKGGTARACAEQDMDLGLELVVAALLQGRALEAESVMVIETVVGDVAAGAMIRQARNSTAVNDFVAAVPGQREWAENFHIMLVAALSLMVVEQRCCDASFAVGEAERDFATRVGYGLLAFQKYHFVSGIEHVSGLRGGDANQAALLEEIADFLHFSRRHDGHFGHFVDELARYKRVHPGQDQAASLTLPVDLACQHYLASAAARLQ